MLPSSNIFGRINIDFIHDLSWIQNIVDVLRLMQSTLRQNNRFVSLTYLPTVLSYKSHLWKWIVEDRFIHAWKPFSLQ